MFLLVPSRCSCADRAAALQLWPKTVLRKWLNIRSPESDFRADEGDTTDDADSEVEYEGQRSAHPQLQASPFPSLILHFSRLRMNCLLA